jgi:hypothetical protein
MKMNFKFMRSPTDMAKEAVQMQDLNQFKVGYIACYEDLVLALKDKNISTLVDLQDVMGKLARRAKSL